MKHINIKTANTKIATLALVSALALTLSSCADIEGNNTAKTTVYFETGKHALTTQAKTTLDGYAASLNNDEVVGTTVTGFADRRGSDKANNALSARRAKTVATYLSGKGVTAIKTAIVNAVGKTQATAECAEGSKGKATSECLSPDRKVEVEVDTKPRLIESGSNAARNNAGLQDRHHWKLNQ
ncbi:MAG: OmpA family protein [Alphaproteobacteria bacterium]|nr:OmpA family protein [Alphaproteobacteria bacterium]